MRIIEKDLDYTDEQRHNIKECMASIKVDMTGSQLFFYEKGKLYMRDMKKGLRIWDVNENKLWILMDVYKWFTAMYVKDGIVYAGTLDGEVLILDTELETGKILTCNVRHYIKKQWGVNSIFVSDDAIYTAHSEGSIRVWPLNTSRSFFKRVSVLSHDRKRVSAATFYKGKIFSAHKDGKLMIWDTEQQQIKILKGESGEIDASYIHNDIVYLMYQDSTIKLWNMRQKEQAFKTFIGLKSKLRLVNFYKGLVLTSNFRHIFRIWDFVNEKVKTLNNDFDNLVSICAGDSMIFTGDHERRIRQWDLNTKRLRTLSRKRLLQFEPYEERGAFRPVTQKRSFQGIFSRMGATRNTEEWAKAKEQMIPDVEMKAGSF